MGASHVDLRHPPPRRGSRSRVDHAASSRARSALAAAAGEDAALFAELRQAFAESLARQVDLLRREHGWWDRFDPTDFGRHADPDQWELVETYIAGAMNFRNLALTAHETDVLTQGPTTTSANAR